MIDLFHNDLQVNPDPRSAKSSAASLIKSSVEAAKTLPNPCRPCSKIWAMGQTNSRALTADWAVSVRSWALSKVSRWIM